MGKKTNTKNKNNNGGTRSSWQNEETLQLENCIMNNETLEEIYKKFPQRSPNSIRSKIKKLRDKNASLPATKATRKMWTKEEDNLLKELFYQNKSNDEINNVFSNRTKRAIEARLTGLIAEERVKKINNIPWAELEKKGIIEIEPENWPVQRVLSEKSIYVLVNETITSNKDFTKNEMRGFLEKAEKENKTRVSFMFCPKKEVFFEKIKGKRALEVINTPPFLQKLVLASLLADGTIARIKPEMPSCFFQFTQAANLLTKNEESHLEYALWFLEQVDFSLLTLVPFTLERGIPKQKTETNSLNFTWKARVRLWNLDLFNEALADNYGGFKEDTSKTEDFIKLTSRGSLLEELKQKSLDLDIDSINSFDIDKTQKDVSISDESYIESDEILENSEFPEVFNVTSSSHYKNLPPYEKLINFYFADPDFSIAHMHMQDGDLLKISNKLSIPRLFLYTIQPIQTLYLSKAIYETMGLKYLPVTYKTPVKKNSISTVLYLCPSSINRFIEMTSKYILPCMFYKQPKHIDEKDPNQRSIISTFDKRFDEIAKKFFN